MKNTLAILFILSSLLVINACSTVKGVGKDLQAGGEKVEQLSDKTKKKI